MNAYPELKLEWEWEPAPTVKAPEHRATWARLEVKIDEEWVTLLEDRDSGSSRRSIYCPLYPLAEWIAYNWWFLRVNARLASRPGSAWSYPSIRQRRLLRHHWMRSAGDGFVWPNLLIVPEGDETRLVWRPDRSFSPGRPIRFISQGEALVDNQGLTHLLSDFVTKVLGRLDEQKVRNTSLEKEWDGIQSADEDEVEFCLAAARLGLDPYSEAVRFESSIVRVAEEFEGRIYSDFLDAVDPTRIGPGLDWAARVRDEIMSSQGEWPPEVRRLRRAVRGASGDHSARPWETGWEQARLVRQILGVGPSERFDLETFVPNRVEPAGDPGLQAVGGSSEDIVPMVVVGRRYHETAQRFTLTRAFWHIICSDEPLFLVTAAHTDRQKVERAFAAELLAPAEGVAQSVSGNSLFTHEELEQVAANFGVSTMVVQHQVENQLSRWEM